MKPQKNSDNWFERNGVNPPTVDSHITEEALIAEFEKLRANTVHGEWTQMGNRLTCNRCIPSHTSEPIPVEYLLQGTDDKGNPILTKLV